MNPRVLGPCLPVTLNKLSLQTKTLNRFKFLEQQKQVFAWQKMQL